MERKATSEIILTLLLISMLTLAFNIQPAKAEWWELEVKVTPEHPGLNDLVNVTVSFTFGSEPPYVEEFGLLNRVGNTFLINVTIYLPAPGEPVYMWVHTDGNVYQLGNLSAGQYKFEVYVETIHYSEEYWLEETVPFTVYAPPVITSTIDIHPQALNLRSEGKWITTYIELPEGYNVSDIETSPVMLNDTVSAGLRPTAIGDHDNDTFLDLMVKFDRVKLIEYILANVDVKERFTTITLTITGKLNDGTPFQGSDTIRIIHMDIWGRFIARWLRCETYIQRYWG